MVDTFGRIDILVNNAYSGSYGRLAELTRRAREQPGLDVLGGQALAQQRVVEQVMPGHRGLAGVRHVAGAVVR